MCIDTNRVAYLKSNKMEEAVEDARECITQAPTWPKAYSRLGRALLARGNELHVMRAAATTRGIVHGARAGGDGCDIWRAEQAFSRGVSSGDSVCSVCIEGLKQAAEARDTLLRQADQENEKAKVLLGDGSFSGASARLELCLLCAGNAWGHTSSAAMQRLRDLADFNDLIHNEKSSVEWRRTLLQHKPQSASRMVDLASALRATGRFDDAASLLKTTVERLSDLYPQGHLESVLALHDLADSFRQSLQVGSANKAYPVMQRAAEMARRVGGSMSVLYAMTLHNLIIILGLLGTRGQDEKELRYRASKLLKALRSTNTSIFVSSVDLWMNPGDLFELNKWPNRSVFSPLLSLPVI